MQRVRHGITVHLRAASKRGGSYFLRREAAQIAVTKILARKGPLADGVGYILNEEKTDALLTIHLNCDPGREVREMLDTKQAYGKKERVNASMASASPTGTTTEEDDSEEDLPPEKP